MARWCWLAAQDGGSLREVVAGGVHREVQAAGFGRWWIGCAWVVREPGRGWLRLAGGARGRGAAVGCRLPSGVERARGRCANLVRVGSPWVFVAWRRIAKGRAGGLAVYGLLAFAKCEGREALVCMGCWRCANRETRQVLRLVWRRVEGGRPWCVWAAGLRVSFAFALRGLRYLL